MKGDENHPRVLEKGHVCFGMEKFIDSTMYGRTCKRLVTNTSATLHVNADKNKYMNFVMAFSTTDSNDF